MTIKTIKTDDYESSLDEADYARHIHSMNRDMIRQRLAGRGPFIVRTSDGKEFRVPHPEFVLVGRYNVIIEQPRGLLDIIDPMHIVSIRPPRRIAEKAAR